MHYRRGRPQLVCDHEPGGPALHRLLSMTVSTTAVFPYEPGLRAPNRPVETDIAYGFGPAGQGRTGRIRGIGSIRPIRQIGPIRRPDRASTCVLAPVNLAGAGTAAQVALLPVWQRWAR